jgi:hypothetical protein
MTLFQAGRGLLASVATANRELTVQILKPAVIQNPNYPSETTLNWNAATISTTVKGNLQPAGTRAVERVGQTGKQGLHELFTDPVTLTPHGRVRIGSRDYLVLDVREHHTHTHAIVEEVTV